MDQYRELQRRKGAGEKESTSEPVYTKKDLGKNKKEPIPLDAMPEEQRNRAAELIVCEKLMQLSERFKIIAKNVKDKGFLSQDPKVQKEIILACEAFIKFMQPLVDDKWTQGEWRNAFEAIAAHLRKDQHWSEDADFVREYRYQIFSDGTVENRHPYTKQHILGGSIVPKVNDIVQISDGILLFASLFENDKQTRHKQILKREEKRKERIRKNGKT